MPYERLKPSFVFNEERLNQLKQVAPEAFVDGKINWDVLKEALGEYVEDESQEVEHFGFFWPGKREARKLVSIPSKGALVPVKGEGIDEEKTRNIFIEGENLEVLKLLQKSYAGKIKMIYIDPPYNTGNDFIYDDNFTEPLEEYLKYTGQMDEEGRVLTTNTKADGRFHSRWLSMMYPRLRLARNLLREDGAIFISIDDNEVAHLKKICDEIFGEENFVGTLKWKRKKQPSFLHGQIAGIIEYIIVYGKAIDKLERLSLEKLAGSDKPIINAGNKIVERILRKGVKVKANVKEIKKGLSTSKSITIEFLNDVKVGNHRLMSDLLIKAPFRTGQDELDGFAQKNLLFITTNLGLRRDLTDEELEKDKMITDLLLDWGQNQDATDEMREMFGKDVFSNPKPVKLVKNLINTLDSEAEIILDFFAGSCTTAHSVFSSNLEDYGNREFIVVQMPEVVENDSEAFKCGYKNIAELGKDRIRKAVKIIKKGDKDKIKDLDLGFKVFKLEKSNFKQWQDYQGKDLKELQQVFEHWQSPLIDGWKEEDLLIEIILQEGFPLDSKIEQLGQYSKNKILQVSSEFCEHKLLICLDKKVYQETINDLALGSDDRFICLDDALNDEQKVRLSDKGFLKTI